MRCGREEREHTTDTTEVRSFYWKVPTSHPLRKEKSTAHPLAPPNVAQL